jgi:hypothetical protein
MGLQVAGRVIVICDDGWVLDVGCWMLDEIFRLQPSAFVSLY